MAKYHPKNPAALEQYKVMLKMAHDESSTLYNKDGSQHSGASHRNHFWNAFNYGTKYQHQIPAYNSLAYPCFRAGLDFKKFSLLKEEYNNLILSLQWKKAEKILEKLQNWYTFAS